LVEDYAGIDDESLKEGIVRITKRLGGLNTKEALEALNLKDYFKVAMLTLGYYDKAYMKGVLNRDRDKIIYIELCNSDYDTNAQLLKDRVEGVLSVE